MKPLTYCTIKLFKKLGRLHGFIFPVFIEGFCVSLIRVLCLVALMMLNKLLMFLLELNCPSINYQPHYHKQLYEANSIAPFFFLMLKQPKSLKIL